MAKSRGEIHEEMAESRGEIHNEEMAESRGEIHNEERNADPVEQSLEYDYASMFDNMQIQNPLETFQEVKPKDDINPRPEDTPSPRARADQLSTAEDVTPKPDKSEDVPGETKNHNVSTEVFANVDHLSAIDEDGDTVLHRSLIHNGTFEEFCYILTTLIIYYFSSFWERLNFQNHEGQTPLHLAVCLNRVDIVQLLLKVRASTGLRDNRLRTPMFRACELIIEEGFDMGVLRCLLQSVRPGELDVVDHNGKTCLHLAIESGHKELAELLIQGGAGVNVKEQKAGYTPLHVAVLRRDISMVNLLLSSAGIHPDIPNYEGLSPMDLDIWESVIHEICPANGITNGHHDDHNGT